MSIKSGNAAFAKRIGLDRVGDEYVYGGTWNPGDVHEGCDCSGEVTDELDAHCNGHAMSWTRDGISTESYRAADMGGNVDPRNGPFGTIQASGPNAYPSDAAVKIALHHGPGGGENSHMWCELADGTRFETHGSTAQYPNGATVTGDQARAMDDPLANNWWYLPGPIVQGNVTMQGLDFAGGRPGGAAIKAAGYDFVSRYVTDGGSGLPEKLLTIDEANDYRLHGVDVVSNFESTADRMRDGFDAGVADAHTALANHFAAGGPGYRPIYFSADFDATEGDQAAIDAYLRGVASVIGLQWTGVYGDYYVCQRCLANGTATWTWQTEAWSGGQEDMAINFYQRNDIGYVLVNGVQADVDVTLTDDFGQWSAAVAPGTAPAPNPAPVPPAPEVYVTQPQDVLNDQRGVDRSGNPEWFNVVYGRADRVHGELVGDPNKGVWNEPYPNGLTEVMGPDGKTPIPPGGVWDHGAHAVLAAEAVSQRYVSTLNERVDIFTMMADLYEYFLLKDPTVMAEAIANAKVKRTPA